MPHEVKGVVSRTKGEPVEINTILIPDPDPRIQDAGGCWAGDQSERRRAARDRGADRLRRDGGLGAAMYDDVEDAFHKMKQRKVLRSVVVMN